MSLYVTSLNSGSNGNCYYIGNDEDAVLIDAGLSCRETEKRMQLLGLSMQRVKAIIISHEHSDHIKGVERLATKYQFPVLITDSTCKHGRINVEKKLLHAFSTIPFNVGTLSITAFAKFHDAIDPHSFMISYGGVNIGVFTDIGRPCDKLLKYFHQCHAAFLESNYDEKLLENGRYPIHLKNRIRGGNGHLSNRQALEVFTMHRPPFMSHLFLSHLSKENNCPDLVKELFTKHSTNTNIIIAGRYQHTPVYTISASALPHWEVKVRPTQLRSQQLSLFA